MAIKEAYVKVQETIIKVPNYSAAEQVSYIAGTIVAPTGPSIGYINSPAAFLATYTKDGKIPRDADITFINAYYLSYSSGLVIARAMNTNAVSGLLYIKGQDEPLKVIYKDGSMMTKKSKITITVDEAVNANSAAAWCFTLGEYLYYHDNSGEIFDITPFDSVINKVECDSVWDMLLQLESRDNIHVLDRSKNGNVYEVTILHTESEMPVNGVSYTDSNRDEFYSDSDYFVGIESVNAEYLEDVITDEQIENALFSIKLKTVGSYSDCHFAISLPEGYTANGTWTLRFKNDLHIDSVTGKVIPYVEKYEVSLNTNAVNADGVSTYIEYINTQDLPFNVEVFNADSQPGDLVAHSNVLVFDNFINDGYDAKISAEPVNLNQALTLLSDQEVFNIEYLAPFGITNLQVVKRLQYVAATHKWFCPIDCPAKNTTLTAVKRYFANVAENVSPVPSGIAMGPFDRNSGLTGWINFIAASTLYWERVMMNKTYQAEFAPVFKSEYGSLSYSDPVKLFKKNERETLLSQGCPINWIVYDQIKNSYYMNDNRTFQTSDNLVREEQTARLVWKISRDMQKLMDQFLGKYNTNTTRQQVCDVIDYYFRWSIMNQRFAPDDYYRICDETNNDAALIREGKMRVEVGIRLYNAIKYIEVLNKVFPIGVDFTSSVEGE